VLPLLLLLTMMELYFASLVRKKIMFLNVYFHIRDSLHTKGRSSDGTKDRLQKPLLLAVHT